jgi:hypothetical protein
LINSIRDIDEGKADITFPQCLHGINDITVSFKNCIIFNEVIQGNVWRIPLWQRGIEGDFINKCFTIIMIDKISPNPSLPKRGIKKSLPKGNKRRAYFKVYPQKCLKKL